MRFVPFVAGGRIGFFDPRFRSRLHYRFDSGRSADVERSAHLFRSPENGGDVSGEAGLPVEMTSVSRLGADGNFVAAVRGEQHGGLFLCNIYRRGSRRLIHDFRTLFWSPVILGDRPACLACICGRKGPGIISFRWDTGKKAVLELPAGMFPEALAHEPAHGETYALIQDGRHSYAARLALDAEGRNCLLAGAVRIETQRLPRRLTVTSRKGEQSGTVWLLEEHRLRPSTLVGRLARTSIDLVRGYFTEMIRAGQVTLEGAGSVADLPADVRDMERGRRSGPSSKWGIAGEESVDFPQLPDEVARPVIGVRLSSLAVANLHRGEPTLPENLREGAPGLKPDAHISLPRPVSSVSHDASDGGLLIGNARALYRISLPAGAGRSRRLARGDFRALPS